MTDAILVFGANGFIGRHLVTALAASGRPVIAVTREISAPIQPNVETISGSFERPEEFAPLLARAQAIIHVASCSTPSRTAGKPLDELEGNLRPTLALLSALQKAPHCDLLYLSSGGALYGDTHEHPAREQDPIRPKSYYGAGKAAAEHFIHAYAMQYHRAATILRPSNIYGPGQTLRGGFGIIPTAFDRTQTNTPLTLWGDGSAMRDYLYIDDFIQLCLTILNQSMPQMPRLLNAASGMGVSLNDLVNTIRKVTGIPMDVIYDTDRAVDIKRIEIDPTIAASCCAWKSHTKLQHGLEHTWKWWQTRS